MKHRHRKFNRKAGKKLLTGTFALLLAATALSTAAFAAPEEPDIFQITEAADDTEQTEAVILAETNEELLQAYIDKSLFPERAEKLELMEAGASSGLSGSNLKIYQKLKKQIRSVANGTRKSTEFSLSKSDMGIPDTFWTARQLGVSAIVKNDAITAEAMEAALTKLNIDSRLIVNALLADCPYDMYWYDKTAGYHMDGFQLTTQYDQTAKEYTLGFASGTTFRFAVAADYAGGTYTVNRTEAVAAAINKMKHIVAQYAAQDDFTRLQSYLQEICDNVSYDYTASETAGYGNPWQLIWVFDEDASTNVVCEGYAKAFQYLCDLSSFQDSGIRCRTVTGVMAGGTGAGRHMWNVVTMNDGRNYLVDVTNCDEGAIGAGTQLFLVGLAQEMRKETVSEGFEIRLGSGAVSYVYDSDTLVLYPVSDLLLAKGRYERHTHVFRKVAKKASTYTKKGNIEYWICDGCGRCFAQADAGQELTAEQTALPLLIKLSQTRITLSKTSCVYSGKAKKPGVTVKDGSKTLKKHIDYKVAYVSNQKVGTATVKIIGMNNYKGMVKKTFRILPKSTSVTKLTKAKKSFIVRWKKQTVQTTGYEIQYCTKKNFSSGAKTVRIKNAKTVSRKIKKLKAKTTYYVRVRTYQKVGTKRYYSAWSKIKKVKTR